MNEVDTVLFDKTGTLTRERPEVGRIIASRGFTPEQILQYAAAAEKKFHHPIALAILHKAHELGLDLPATDDTRTKSVTASQWQSTARRSALAAGDSWTWKG